MSAIRISFFGADFVNHLGVCNFFVVVGWDGIVADNKEGVGAVNAFAGGIQVGADVLAEMAQLVCVQFFPNLVKLMVLAELTVLESCLVCCRGPVLPIL